MYLVWFNLVWLAGWLAWLAHGYHYRRGMGMSASASDVYPVVFAEDCCFCAYHVSWPDVSNACNGLLMFPGVGEPHCTKYVLHQPTVYYVSTHLIDNGISEA
jgi:hypothetical protein